MSNDTNPILSEWGRGFGLALRLTGSVLAVRTDLISQSENLNAIGRVKTGNSKLGQTAKVAVVASADPQ